MLHRNRWSKCAWMDSLEPRTLFSNAPGFFPGMLDQDFGVNGRVVTDIANGYDFALAVTAQRDGKVLVAGISSLPIIGGGLIVVRYDAQGRLDSSFGDEGKFILEGSHYARDIAASEDGRIFVGAETWQGPERGADLSVLCLNEDGVLDPTFGNNGIASGDFFGRNEELTHITLQNDGKILVIGSARPTGIDCGDLAVMRFNADGTIDTRFGRDGKVVFNFTTSRIYGCDSGGGIAVSSDGAILISGNSINALSSESPRIAFIIKLTEYGALDKAFGNHGMVQIPDRVVHDLALNANGNIIIAGEDDANSNFYFARFLPDGTVDSSFGIAGSMLHNVGSAAVDVELEPDGKIIATGFYTGGDLTIVRLASSGMLDPEFGVQGIVRTSFPNVNGVHGTAIALTADGKLVASGIGGPSLEEMNLLAARYLLQPVQSPQQPFQSVDLIPPLRDDHKSAMMEMHSSNDVLAALLN